MRGEQDNRQNGTEGEENSNNIAAEITAITKNQQSCHIAQDGEEAENGRIWRPMVQLAAEWVVVDLIKSEKAHGGVVGFGDPYSCV